MQPRPLLAWTALAVLVMPAWPAVGGARMLLVPDDYPTVTLACNAAVSGDTVGIQPGEYYDEYPNVRAGVAVLGLGADRDGVWLEGSHFYCHSGNLRTVIGNLSIAGSLCISVGNNPQLHIQGCHLEAPAWDAACIVSSSSGFTMSQCDIWYLVDYAEAIRLNAPGHVLVVDCIWWWTSFREGLVPAGSVFEFRNNTFFAGTGFGGWNEEASHFTVVWTNNIFYHAPSCGDHPADAVEWRHNDFWIGSPPQCGYMVGNFHADPLFCGDPNEDVRLTPESPCWGAGENGADVGARVGTCGDPWPSYIPYASDAPRQATLRLSAPRPNPSTGSVVLLLDGAVDGVWIDARVLDAGGRVVRLLPETALGQSGRIHWDGRTQSGEAAPSGTYFISVTAGGGGDSPGP